MLRPLRKNVLWLVLLVAVGFLVPQICFTWALKKEFVGVVAFVVYSYPCFAILVARVTLSEPFPRAATGALVLLLIGLFMVITDGQAPGISLASRWTYLLAALAVAVSWGTSTVLSKHLMNKGVSPSVLALARTSLGALLLGPLVLWGVVATPAQLSSLDWSDWALLAYSGFVPIAVGLPLYLKGLSRTTVTQASFVEACTPILAASLAVPVLSERLSAVQWTGGALVVGATVVAATVSQKRFGVASGGNGKAAAVGSEPRPIANEGE